MGWFWSDPAPSATPIAPHPITKPGATPPPECPMHTADTSKPSPLAQRLQSSPSESLSQSQTSPPSSCPVKSPAQASRYPTDPSTPIDPPNLSQQQKQSTSSWSSTLNPLNYMPTFQNEKPADSPQAISLALEREISSIPRGDSDANWEYPSPQQMYNAMLRKGHTDTPAEDVTSMVAVHNFLNEGAWNEIVEWENLFSNGLATGWEKCRRGEQGIAMARAKREYLAELREERRRASGMSPSSLPQTDEVPPPKLLRFQGRPSEPTPKARVLQALAKAFPEKFGQEPPFDRHDWYVARNQADGSVKEVRYVIDYYGGGLQATGEPVFYLDIRPALDTPTAVAERAIRWTSDVWWTATGSGVRERLQREAREAAAAATK